MRACKFFFWVGCLFAALGAASRVFCEDVKESSKNPLRKIGGFRCVDLNPYRNDATFDLYQIGWWSYSAITRDIWKRHGVPFWYPQGLGDIFVAGERWTPPSRAEISSAESGGVARADNQQPGNGAIAFANDNNLSTYWYAGDNRPHGKLSIDFAKAEPVSSIRFFGFATGRHAPKDYRVGVILPDGSEKEIASVKDEKRMGQWISFDAKSVKAKGIYLDVASTVENEHGPVVYEFQARLASPRPAARKTRRRPKW